MTQVGVRGIKPIGCVLWFESWPEPDDHFRLEPHEFGGVPRKQIWAPSERDVCVRTGGWWRPNVPEGFCEYQLPMP